MRFPDIDEIKAINWEKGRGVVRLGGGQLERKGGGDFDEVKGLPCVINFQWKTKFS